MRVSDHAFVITWIVKTFFVQFFCDSCHLFLISSASVRFRWFLSFIDPIFAWYVPLVSLVFLKQSLVFPILLFSSISLQWSLRKAFLSLLSLLCNSAFKWVYLHFSHLLFTAPLYTTICKPPQTAMCVCVCLCIHIYTHFSPLPKQFYLFY